MVIHTYIYEITIKHIVLTNFKRYNYPKVDKISNFGRSPKNMIIIVLRGKLPNWCCSE